MMSRPFINKLTHTLRQSNPMTSETVLLNVTSRSSSIESFGFEMKIENFSSLGSVKINSSEMITSHECKTAWRIVLNTLPRENNPYYGLYYNAKGMKVGLRRIDSNKCDVKASLFFEIQNSNEDVYVREAIIEKIFSLGNQSEFYICSIQRPSKGNYVKGMHGTNFLLRDNKLVIKGNILIQDCCPKNKAETDRDSVMNLTELQCNLKKSYQNNLFSDVVFILGDDKLHAHKIVLSARSPVFKKMFEQNMKEKDFNSVKITDMEKSVFDVFLIFLYTGVVENKELDTVMSLYAAADKYEVTILFKTCSNILESYISDKTASVILKLADMHSDESLKEKAVQFICENFTKVEETLEWNNLLATNPRLASYVLKMVLSSVAAKEKNLI